MRFLNDTAISTQSFASTVSSSPISACQTVYASAQILTTGTIAGTLVIQASNDQTSVPTNWNNVASATATVSASGVVLMPVVQICHQWIRLVFTPSAGTGDGTVNLHTQTF